MKKIKGDFPEEIKTIIKDAENMNVEYRDISDLASAIIGEKIVSLQYFTTDSGNFAEVVTSAGSVIFHATSDISVLERQIVDNTNVN